MVQQISSISNALRGRRFALGKHFIRRHVSPGLRATDKIVGVGQTTVGQGEVWISFNRLLKILESPLKSFTLRLFQ